MKTIVEFAKKSNALELVLFSGMVCLAITAGYASLSSRPTAALGDITGSAQGVKKVTPLATMQPMPEALPADAN